MVAFSFQDSLRSQSGNGIIDSLLTPFTVKKYGNEAHARSLDPNHFLQGYNYVGPQTEVLLREKIHDDVPLNDLDQAAKNHDYSYLHEKEVYQKDHNKPLHMKNIWHSDDVFVQKSKASHDDPIMGSVASRLIATKEKLEKANLMDTKRFSGMGNDEEEEGEENESISDPAARLRQLVQSQYKNELRRSKKMKRRHHKGGSLTSTLIEKGTPIAVSALSSVASKLVGDLYDYIKSKFSKKKEGKGFVFDHKTIPQKQKLILEILQNLK